MFGFGTYLLYFGSIKLHIFELNTCVLYPLLLDPWEQPRKKKKGTENAGTVFGFWRDVKATVRIQSNLLANLSNNCVQVETCIDLWCL